MNKIIYHKFRSRPKKHYPPFPSNYCTEYLDSVLAEKEYGMRLVVAQGYDAEMLYAMVEGGLNRNKFAKMLLNKYINNPKYLNGLVKWSENRVNSLRDHLEINLSKSNFNKLSNKEVIKHYNKYVSLYILFHLKNTPPWWIGAEAVETELRKSLATAKFSDSESAFQILASGSEFSTELLLEELSLLDICIALNKKGIKQLKSKQGITKPIRLLFEKHIKEFGAIGFGYNTGVIWDEKYLIKEINNILKNKYPPIKIKENKLQAVKTNLKIREEFEKKNKISNKIKILARALRQLSYLQDLKKSTQTRSHPHLVNVVYPEVARRTGLKKK